MKDYYDILDVPLNASVEQIKSRYKQLVRIYHPDRFSNALDKVYAEHKLKQVNEAYAFLTSDTEGMTFFNTIAVPPEPVVEPAVLDFGILHPGDQQILRFEVSNTGGPASGVTFVCSEENSWFRISNGKRVDPAKTLPMVFEVVADIHPRYPAQHYGGWIEISMGGVKARVELLAEVQEKQAATALSMASWQLPTVKLPSLQMGYRLFALVGSFVLLAIFLNTPLPGAMIDLFNNIRVTQSAALVSAASEPTVTATQPAPTEPPPVPTETPAPVATLPVVTRVVETTVVEQVLPTTIPSPVPAEQIVSPAQDRTAFSDEALPPDVAQATLSALALDATVVAILNEATPTAPPTPATLEPATPTATVVPTDPPAATASPLPTATSLPTDTPVPLPTPTPLPTATAITEPTATPLLPSGLYEILLADGSTRQAITLEIPADHTVNVRYAWDVRSPALAVLVGGTRLPAVGRSNDNTWVQVALPDGQLGWIFTEVINIDNSQIEQLPLTLAPSWP